MYRLSIRHRLRNRCLFPDHINQIIEDDFSSRHKEETSRLVANVEDPMVRKELNLQFEEVHGKIDALNESIYLLERIIKRRAG